MKEERIKKLKKELKYLIDEEINKEIIDNLSKLDDENINVRNLAEDIYLKRGLNITRLQKNHWSNLVDNFTDMVSLFKEKSKDTKKKMVIDIIYIVVFLILIKIPFDLIQDIGYEFIEVLSNNALLGKIWDLIFALLYTITVLCMFFVFLRNFNVKFKNAK